jgi:hypothetical protein
VQRDSGNTCVCHGAGGYHQEARSSRARDLGLQIRMLSLASCIMSGGVGRCEGGLQWTDMMRARRYRRRDRRLIAAGLAHTFLAHVTVRSSSRRGNQTTTKRTTGRRPAFKPQRSTLEMLDRQCPRVVETREPATETTLEDVLARNLSIHGVMHAHAPTWRLQPRVACTASALQYFAELGFYVGSALYCGNFA